MSEIKLKDKITGQLIRKEVRHEEPGLDGAERHVR